MYEQLFRISLTFKIHSGFCGMFKRDKVCRNVKNAKRWVFLILRMQLTNVQLKYIVCNWTLHTRASEPPLDNQTNVNLKTTSYSSSKIGTEFVRTRFFFKKKFRTLHFLSTRNNYNRDKINVNLYANEISLRRSSFVYVGIIKYVKKDEKYFQRCTFSYKKFQIYKRIWLNISGVECFP